MKLDYLREFLVVAETLNFTAAAEQLFITQSALSRHIAVVEEYFGARLLERSTHRVRLTPIGEIAYTEIGRVLVIIDTLKTKAELMDQGSTGAVRLGVPYYSMNYLDAIFPVFRSRFPDIILEIISYQPTQAYNALIEGSIDVALLFHHTYPDEDELEFHDFATEPLVLVSLQGHPLSVRPRVSLMELRGHTIVKFRNNYLSDFTNSILEKHHIKTKDEVYSDSLDTLPYSLLESNGVAIEPLSVRNMPRPELAYTEFLEEEMEVPLAMVHPKNSHNQAVSAFLRVVSEQYQA